MHPTNLIPNTLTTNNSDYWDDVFPGWDVLRAELDICPHLKQLLQVVSAETLQGQGSFRAAAECLGILVGYV